MTTSAEGEKSQAEAKPSEPSPPDPPDAGQLKQLADKMDKIFARFDGVDARFDGVDIALKDMKKSVDDLTKRVGSLEDSFDDLGKRIDLVEADAAIARRIASNRAGIGSDWERPRREPMRGSTQKAMNGHGARPSIRVRAAPRYG